MDITQLKNFLRENIKYIASSLLFIVILLSFFFKLTNLDQQIAVSLINNDLLTRSIDEENYIIHHKMIFDEKKLIENIQDLYNQNDINVSFKVIVKENKVNIIIGKESLDFEIINNSIN